MTLSLPELTNPDVIHCLSRGVVLGVLVSSEALLARRKRLLFERHLVLFTTVTFLLLAEVFGIVLGLWVDRELVPSPSHLWVWYPLLSSVGLLGIMLWFDYVRSSFIGSPLGQGGWRVRRNSRYYLTVAALIFAMGALLSGKQFVPVEPPTSYGHLGDAAIAVHGIHIAVILAVLFKSCMMFGKWFSRSESRAYVGGCLMALLGAAAQLRVGPREPFTTFAYAIFVAVYLRDNYRRSEREAVHAAEDRRSKTLLFHRITTQLKSTFELDRLCDVLMENLADNLGAESGGIYIRESSNGQLKPVLIYGNYPPPLPLPKEPPVDPAAMTALLKRTLISPGEGIIGKVAKTGAPDYIYDENDAARHYLWPTGSVRVSTAIALPLRSPEGIYGAVQLVNRVDGKPFNEEDLRFLSLLIEQAGLAIYNVRLHEEIIERQRAEQQLKVAQQIQQRLIPSELPRIPGVAIGVEYHVAQDVGGDYYDFYRIDHDHLGILIFDVAGKGVPGAMLMAITRTYLKMAAPRSVSPAWVLNEVNAALSAELRRGLFITAIYGVLTLSSLEFSFCCAGHTEILVARRGQTSCEMYKPHGAALGLLRPNRFRAVLEHKTVQLRQGDTLLLYTDGVIEAMNEDGKEFGQERLHEMFCSLAPKGPDALTTGIARAVKTHTGASPQYDDITLVALGVGDDVQVATPSSETE